MKNKKLKENFLERKPMRANALKWDADENGDVTLYIENKGVFNLIAQKLFKKPKTTKIHLDKIGSFVWPLIDGNSDIIHLGKLVEEKFGEEAHPLYERLGKYFAILESYNFIIWNINNQ